MMKFEIEIKDGIKYTVRHMANGDLVEIQTPYSAKPIKGFLRKIAAASEIRRSA